MNKIFKYSIFSALLIIIIIIFWYGVTYKLNSKQVNKNAVLPKTVGVSCLYSNDPVKQEECYRNYQKVLMSTSTNACQNMEGAIDQEACSIGKKIELVATDGNLSQCNELNGKYKDACINQGAFSLAILKKDPAWCNQILHKDILKQCLDVVNATSSGQILNK